jgi:hypothetical protein
MFAARLVSIQDLADAKTAAARAAGPKLNGALGKLNEAVTHGTAPGSKKPAKSSVALRMRETADQVDKEFERY